MLGSPSRRKPAKPDQTRRLSFPRGSRFDLGKKKVDAVLKRSALTGPEPNIIRGGISLIRWSFSWNLRSRVKIRDWAKQNAPEFNHWGVRSKPPLRSQTVFGLQVRRPFRSSLGEETGRVSKEPQLVGR